MQAAATQAAPEDVRAFIQEYFDAWRGSDEHEILVYYSEEVALQLPTGNTQREDRCARQLCAPFYRGVPRHVHSIRNLAHSKNLVAVEWSLEAVHMAVLPISRRPTKRSRFPGAPFTNTISKLEGFRPDAFTSILRRFLRQIGIEA